MLLGCSEIGANQNIVNIVPGEMSPFTVIAFLYFFPSIL